MRGPRLPLVFAAFPLPFLLCALALAQPITAFWQPVTITPQAIADDPLLANMQCWDLLTITTGNWNSALLAAHLPEGMVFYKHPLGGFTRPDPALIGAAPALDFTTYVSRPATTGPTTSRS